MKKEILILTLLFVSQTYAFKLNIHNRITSTSLQQDGFDAEAINKVIIANQTTDIIHPANLAAHADDNELASSSDRLQRRQNGIITDLESCKRNSALIKLGEALHTVQDIYSHTNAVDNNLLPDLEGSGILEMSNGTEGCNGENGTFKEGELVSGYFNLFGFINGGFSDYGSCYGSILFPVTTVEDGDCCHMHLNKDNASVLNGARSGEAQLHAVAGTLNYLNLLDEEIETKYKATPEIAN